jgi:hypothetical protein
MSEQTLLEALTNGGSGSRPGAAELAGLLWYHAPDPRRCDNCGHLNLFNIERGFPDLWIPQAPVLHVWETKTERGGVEADQREWMRQLASCTEVDARVVRPRDLDGCIETLLAGKLA